MGFVGPSNTINVRPNFLEKDLGECYIKQEKSKDEEDVKQNNTKNVAGSNIELIQNKNKNVTIRKGNIFLRYFSNKRLRIQFS